MGDRVVVFWPTTVSLGNIEEPTELPQQLVIAITDQINDPRRLQVVPGQCCAKLPLLAVCSWNYRMIHKNHATLRCHQIEGHEGSHAHNMKTEVQIKWKSNLNFDEVDWQAIQKEHLKRLEEEDL